MKRDSTSSQKVIAAKKKVLKSSSPLRRAAWVVQKKLHFTSELQKGLLKIWRDFCSTTPIVGLRYIGGHQPAEFFYRILWILLWSSQFLLCVWFSSTLFQRYLEFEVHTSMTYDTVDRLAFPAITICNQNMFRRAKVGGNFQAMVALGAAYAKTKNDIDNTINEYNRTCFKQLDINSTVGNIFFDGKSFVDVMDLVARDSETDVAKCWWNNELINCTGLFSNHITDYGWCFTFNQDESESKNDAEGNGSLNFGGYGLIKQKLDYVVKSSSDLNGLKLLLNTDQNDYCGVAKKWSGAGFYIQLHDPRMQPDFWTTSSIALQPGYDYRVSMQPIFFRRKTEHLGLCLSNFYVKMYPHNQYYFQMACRAQCITERIKKKCGCFPTNFMGKESTLAQIYDLPLEEAQTCNTIDQMFCMRDSAEIDFTQRINEVCPECKVACMEWFYDYKLSSAKFSKRHLELEVAKDLNVTLDSIRRSFVTVSFFYDSMTLLTVVESQAFTSLDLAISFGWAMSLFLGLSFMTPFEILFHIVLSVDKFVRLTRRRHKIRVLRKTVARSY